jgi:hypothetical protein
MPKFGYRIEILASVNFDIEADSEEEALAKAEKMRAYNEWDAPIINTDIPTPDDDANGMPEYTSAQVWLSETVPSKVVDEWELDEPS